MGKEKSKKGSKNVMTILGGNFLVKEKFSKQFPFIVVVTVLLMLIIGNTYIAEERNREIARTTKELSDLHVEYIQLKSAIMQASKQSVLSEKLKDYGVKESIEPIRRISTTDITQSAGLPNVSEEPTNNTSEGSNEVTENPASSMGNGTGNDTVTNENANKL